MRVKVRVRGEVRVKVRVRVRVRDSKIGLRCLFHVSSILLRSRSFCL